MPVDANSGEILSMAQLRFLSTARERNCACAAPAQMNMVRVLVRKGLVRICDERQYDPLRGTIVRKVESL